MEKRELETKAEQYKREMMRIYERSCASPAAQNTDGAENTEDSEQDASDANEEEVTEEVNENECTEEVPLPYSDDDIELRFPEPDLSELELTPAEEPDDIDTPPEYPNEESMGNSIGYIRVNVRTGRDSSIVEDAYVTVTATVNGKKLVLASDKTDLSGSTRVFSLPAPDESFSQSPSPKVRPYSLFDVNVTADGFFNSISVDVPVFSGITSVQDFNMVPIPLQMNSSDETVVYYNQEPFFENSSNKGG